MNRLAVRPQPLGMFPLPAGYLVLPPSEGLEPVQAALLRGLAPTGEVPAALRFYLETLAQGPEAGLAALGDDSSPEARYNRFVLRSEPETYEQLRGELNGELALLLELVAYTLGWVDTPPEPGEATAELRACVLSAQAAQALEQGEYAAAEQVLEEAVAAARPASPLLAAQLLIDLADTRMQLRGLDGQVLGQYREAHDLLDGSGLVMTRAQLALKLGMAYHEIAGAQREPLLEAARYYQDALRVLTRASDPEAYALAQNNLALAYLAMPLSEASDQLRMGIAVQALREALTVYTRTAYPAQWARAQLNLANALQYLPSSHPEENLAEAVALYEETLQARDAASDPLGYARVLANQGNALAHLGIFEHARPKLAEAQALFAGGGDADSANSVADLLAEIARHDAP